MLPGDVRDSSADLICVRCNGRFMNLFFDGKEIE